MKKLLLTLATVVVLQLVFASGASAEYHEDSDKNISIETGLNTSLPEAGDETFQLQEEIHHNFTDTTGEEIDHYYIWIEVDGQDVIAIDPIRGMY